mgnify:CR=1 FL=1
MEIGAFLGIGIVGAALSLVVEYIKAKSVDQLNLRTLVIALSLVVGSVYWVVAGTVYYETVLGVLASASTVYALFFNK